MGFGDDAPHGRRPESSYEGTLIARLAVLQSNWVFSWPEPDQAPFVDEVALLAGEEFDALVFNAMHGYYRQAIGCLRNALETLMIAAGLAVTASAELFAKWRNGQEITFGQARAWLRDSPAGHAIDGHSPGVSVFGDDDADWAKARYKRLCAYAHSQAGYNNADFWESNSPVFRPHALEVVEIEFRETLALGYLLMRLAWPSYKPGPGPVELLAGPTGDWARHVDRDCVVRRFSPPERSPYAEAIPAGVSCARG